MAEKRYNIEWLSDFQCQIIKLDEGEVWVQGQDNMTFTEAKQSAIEQSKTARLLLKENIGKTAQNEAKRLLTFNSEGFKMSEKNTGKHTEGLLAPGTTLTELHFNGYIIYGQGEQEIGGLSLEANVNRLVAAWNACEGIETAALEAGCVKDMMEFINHIANMDNMASIERLDKVYIKDACAIAAKVKTEGGK